MCDLKKHVLEECGLLKSAKQCRTSTVVMVVAVVVVVMMMMRVIVKRARHQELSVYQLVVDWLTGEQF